MNEKYASVDKNQTGLLNTIKYILTQKDKIKIVSDLAFDSVDADESNSLEQEELTEIMKEVARDLRVKAPTDQDVTDILQILDEDGNDCIDKEEFVQLIMMVFDKMLENEIDLIKTINDRSKGHEHDHDHGHEHGHGHGHGHSHAH